MLLSDYRPRSKLVLPLTLVERPRFPVFDAHNHLDEEYVAWNKRPLPALLADLDAADVRMVVDLAGWRSSEKVVNRHLDQFKAAAPERFCVFGGVQWSAWPEHGDRFGEWAAARLRAQAARGVQGLKIWKNLGLKVRDQHGGLVDVADPRLDPLWAAAGELRLPVLIHVADPVAFFDPLDQFNERWEELRGYPDWQFPSPPYPSFLSLVEGLARVVERHPATTFIGAHMGCYVENLAWVGALLDRCPNFHVDITRLNELGRQPYTARHFFLRYADRILFGTDEGVNLAAYRMYYRFLETEDEYFDYDPGGIPQLGRWCIYGLSLPDDVLQKVYSANAARVILGRPG
jgi:predicted TIM-barrel fold metal-dependent hydrolase